MGVEDLGVRGQLAAKLLVVRRRTASALDRARRPSLRSLCRAIGWLAVADQVLIFADTERSPELRHELPVAIGDAVPVRREQRIALRPDQCARGREDEEARRRDADARRLSGSTSCSSPGRSRGRSATSSLLRACRDLGITDAAVPFWFPVDLADFLRENGIELRADRRAVRRAPALEERGRDRRDPARAEGRRGGHATSPRDMLRASEPGDGGLVLDGEPLTVERMKVAIEAGVH